MVNSKIIKVACTILLATCLCGCSLKQNSELESVRQRVPEGQYGIAVITDSGNICDMSFNQATYEAAKSFAEDNNVIYTAKKPNMDTDESKEEMIRLAIAEGYNIIVLPGYSFAGPIVNCSKDYPNVKFIALDVSDSEILYAALGEKYDSAKKYDVTEYYNSDNTYLVTYKEEQSGFMAGYAAVKMGYRKLGFMGGVAEPAVMRFGYGYIQGADLAAKELGVTSQVEIKYAYAGTYSPNIEIKSTCQNWYKSGTEVIFSCGGSIYSSVAQAAYKCDGKMIGVDVDQKEAIDYYGDKIAITSATKGLGASVTNALEAIVNDNTWDELAGKIDNLGLVDATDMSANYVQLPDSTEWTKTFSQEDYKSLVQNILNEKYIIDAKTDNPPEANISVEYIKGELTEE